MKGFAAIFKRELYAFFASPIFYVVGGIFLILCGYFFYTSVAYFSLISFQAAQNPNAGGQVNLNEMVVKPLFDDMSIILLLIVPMLTMRLLAEEKKNGTIELLLTYPVREATVVLGKYLATLFIVFILLALTAVASRTG
jgi:ABC-2 type transport system permease protein